MNIDIEVFNPFTNYTHHENGRLVWDDHIADSLIVSSLMTTHEPRGFYIVTPLHINTTFDRKRIATVLRWFDSEGYRSQPHACVKFFREFNALSLIPLAIGEKISDIQEKWYWTFQNQALKRNTDYSFRDFMLNYYVNDSLMIPIDETEPFHWLPWVDAKPLQVKASPFPAILSDEQASDIAKRLKAIQQELSALHTLYPNLERNEDYQQWFAEVSDDFSGMTFYEKLPFDSDDSDCETYGGNTRSFKINR